MQEFESLSVESSYTVVLAECSPDEVKVQRRVQQDIQENAAARAATRMLPGCFEAQHQLIWSRYYNK